MSVAQALAASQSQTQREDKWSAPG